MGFAFTAPFLLTGCATSNEPVDLSLKVEIPSVPTSTDEVPEVNALSEFDPFDMSSFEHSLFTMMYPGDYRPNELAKERVSFEDEAGLGWMYVTISNEPVAESYRFFEASGDATFANSEGSLWMGQGYCDGPASENCGEPRIMYLVEDGERTYEIVVIGVDEENEMTDSIFNSFTLLPQA